MIVEHLLSYDLDHKNPVKNPENDNQSIPNLLE